MKTEWTPKNVMIAVAGVITVLLVLPNLGKGWEVVKYLADSFPTAYAAKEVAAEVRSDFDQYIAQEQENAKLEKQRLELQQEYNGQLLKLQQQQQAMPRVWQEQDQEGNWYCTDGRESWWPDREGRC